MVAPCPVVLGWPFAQRGPYSRYNEELLPNPVCVFSGHISCNYSKAWIVPSE